jgi:hypothetical protein
LFRNLPAIVVIGIFGFLGCLFLYEGSIESIVFNKEYNMLYLKRTTSTCSKKETVLNLNHIERVYAVRRGINKKEMNTTHYCLIIKMVTGQKLKILETRNT